MAAKQNVKRRIVDAAWELFYEKGYDDTTVDDIIRLSNFQFECDDSDIFNDVTRNVIQKTGVDG